MEGRTEGERDGRKDEEMEIRMEGKKPSAGTSICPQAPHLPPAMREKMRSPGAHRQLEATCPLCAVCSSHPTSPCKQPRASSPVLPQPQCHQPPLPVWSHCCCPSLAGDKQMGKKRLCPKKRHEILSLITQGKSSSRPIGREGNGCE